MGLEGAACAECGGSSSSTTALGPVLRPPSVRASLTANAAWQLLCRGEVGGGSGCLPGSFLWQEIEELIQGDRLPPSSPPSGKDQAGGNKFSHSDLGKGILRPFPPFLCHSCRLKS